MSSSDSHSLPVHKWCDLSMQRTQQQDGENTSEYLPRCTSQGTKYYNIYPDDPAPNSVDGLQWEGCCDRSLLSIGIGCLVQKNTKQNIFKSLKTNEGFGSLGYFFWCFSRLLTAVYITITQKLHTTKQMCCNSENPKFVFRPSQLYKYSGWAKTSYFFPWAFSTSWQKRMIFNVSTRILNHPKALLPSSHLFALLPS